MFRVILLGFILFATLQVTLPTQSYAISLDDDEEDAEDVADLLAEAKKAGKSESFDKADALLKKAKMYGVNTDETRAASSYAAKKKQAKADRLERERKERERQAKLAAQRADSYASNYGLPKSQCYRTSGSFALHKYCNSGDCIGFVSSYKLYQLCQYDNPIGFNSNQRDTEIRLYLEGSLSQLSYDNFSNKAAYQSGKHNGSFQERKNFILYLLSGMVLVRY